LKGVAGIGFIKLPTPFNLLRNMLSWIEVRLHFLFTDASSLLKNTISPRGTLYLQFVLSWQKKRKRR